VITSLIPSAMVICCIHAWKQQKNFWGRSSIMQPQTGQLCS